MSIYIREAVLKMEENQTMKSLADLIPIIINEVDGVKTDTELVDLINDICTLIKDGKVSDIRGFLSYLDIKVEWPEK